jgi:hypothetical protein
MPAQVRLYQVIPDLPRLAFRAAASQQNAAQHILQLLCVDPAVSHGPSLAARAASGGANQIVEQISTNIVDNYGENF